MRLTTRHRIAGALGILALTVAACGSSSSSSSSAGSASATPTPPITKGGIMNIGTPQEPTSFMAAGCPGCVDSMTFSVAVDAPIAEGLLWFKSTEETANAKSIADYYQPWLATEIPTVANGDVKTTGCANSAAKMCVTWKLRTGVTWHDGSTFSAHDVCATADFMWLKYGAKNPTSLLSTTGSDQMIKCTENNTNQITIDFKSIYAPYLSLFTGVYGIFPATQLQAAFAGNTDLEKTPQTVDLSKGTNNPDAFKGTDTLDKIIVGTGPYVLQSYVPTKSVTLVANKNYWNKSHQPNLDKVVFNFVADIPTQLNQVKAGELDFGLDYRLKYLKDLQDTAKLGKVAVETIPDSGAEKIDVNICAGNGGKCGGPPAKANKLLADVKLRKAMLEAINRQQIVDTIANKATVIPSDGWQYLGATYAKPSGSTDPVTAYNVQKAQSDLDAAGYKVSPSCHGGVGRADPSGTCLDFGFVTTSGNTARSAAQVAIQQDLQAVGIYTNLSTIKSGTLFGSFTDGGVLYTHQFDLAMYTNTMSSPAEVDSYYPGYVSTQIPSAANSGQGQNDTGVADPTVDAGFDQGRTSPDLTGRADGYKKAIGQLASLLPELPLYQQVTVNSYSTKLQGLQRNDLVWTYNMYDWNCTGGVCQA